jgi:hypothetical protein
VYASYRRRLQSLTHRIRLLLRNPERLQTADLTKKLKREKPIKRNQENVRLFSKTTKRSKEGISGRAFSAVGGKPGIEQASFENHPLLLKEKDLSVRLAPVLSNHVFFSLKIMAKSHSLTLALSLT